MSRIKNDIVVSPQELMVQTTTQQCDLGARAVTADGREFRYVYNGAVALASGVLVQAPAIVANHQNMATVTAAIGATAITVTLGSGAVVANAYAGGFLVVNAGTGIGQTLKVASHPASAGGTTMVVTLEDPLNVAILTADSKVSLLPSLYNGVVINPTTPTNVPVGVTIFPLAINNFGWLQTKGPVSCLNDGSTTVGLAIAPSQGTPGAVKTGATTLDSVGSALQAGVTTESRMVHIRIS